jgi:hypothetical protein
VATAKYMANESNYVGDLPPDGAIYRSFFSMKGVIGPFLLWVQDLDVDNPFVIRFLNSGTEEKTVLERLGSKGLTLLNFQQELESGDRLTVEIDPAEGQTVRGIWFCFPYWMERPDNKNLFRALQMEASHAPGPSVVGHPG